MDLEHKNLAIMTLIQAAMLMENLMAKDNTNGAMVHILKVNLKMGSGMEKVNGLKMLVSPILIKDNM